jgi:hypothetical protein
VESALLLSHNKFCISYRKTRVFWGADIFHMHFLSFFDSNRKLKNIHSLHQKSRTPSVGVFYANNGGIFQAWCFII